MNPTVTIYTAPNCGACTASKSSLKRREVDYTEVDLSTDPEALKMVKALGYAKAPVMVLTDPATDRVLDHWSGYRLDKLKTIALDSPSGASPPWPALAQQVDGPRTSLQAPSPETSEPRVDLMTIPGSLSHELHQSIERERPTIDIS